MSTTAKHAELLERIAEARATVEDAGAPDVERQAALEEWQELDAELKVQELARLAELDNFGR